MANTYLEKLKTIFPDATEQELRDFLKDLYEDTKKQNDKYMTADYCLAIMTNSPELKPYQYKKHQIDIPSITKYMKDAYEQELQTIKQYAESPIELLFGNQLLVSFAMLRYMNLSYPFKELLKRNDMVKEIFKEACSVRTIPVVQLQPQFQLKNKKRIDYTVFVYTLKKTYLLGIELDGYEYHKDKFVEDRIKEREAKKEGYDLIMRFSGSEVYRFVSGCTGEVIDWVNEVYLHGMDMPHA